jgi:fibronectin-binding autotransporter adhesin
MHTAQILRSVLLACCITVTIGVSQLRAGNFVLSSFTATVNGMHVDLAWGTASELSCDHFIIERTTDGANYTEVTRVTGGGTSSMPLAYSATDVAPAEGVSYYRLKQTDVNGGATYSSHIAVTFTRGEAPAFMTYPNPGNGSQLNIRVEAEEGEELTVIVRGVMGREFYRQIVRADKTGENVFALQPDHQLETGTYMVVVTSGKTVHAMNWMVR